MAALRGGASPLAVRIWGFFLLPVFSPGDGAAGCLPASPRSPRLGKNTVPVSLSLSLCFSATYSFCLPFASLQLFNTEGTATARTLYSRPRSALAGEDGAAGALP